MQLHELVQKSRHHLRFAETNSVVKRFEINKVGAVDACSFAEHGVGDWPPAALLRAVFNVVCNGLQLVTVAIETRQSRQWILPIIKLALCSFSTIAAVCILQASDTLSQ